MNRVLETLFWISVAVVGYSYIGYPVVLALFARLFGRPTHKGASSSLRFGFLVPAYNEESVIKKKIENILALEYPPDLLSIWIGSDRSSDRTVAIVRGFNDPRIHLWEAPRRGGKTVVLNSVAPLIDADIILFTDANTMHRPDSLRAMAEAFGDPRVGGVAGQIVHAVEGSSEFEEKAYRLFEVFQKVQESALHSTISCFGGFYAVRKSLFEPIAPNSYSNDDVLIPMGVVRRGYRVVFEPRAVSTEDMTESLSSEFRRRVRIGAGNFQAFFRLLDFLNPLKGWPWFCYLSHKVTRWFSPICIALGLVACWILSEFQHLFLYRVLFGCAVVVIAAGISSQVFPIRLTKRVFYFMSMNIALIAGLFRYCRGIRSAAWDRTERK